MKLKHFIWCDFVNWQNIVFLEKSNTFEVNALNTFLLFCYFFHYASRCYAREALVQICISSPMCPGQCWHGRQKGEISMCGH